MSAADIGATVGTIIVVTILVLLLVDIGNKRTLQLGRFTMKPKKGWLIAHILCVLVFFTGVFGSIFLTIVTFFTTNKALIYAAQMFSGTFDWFLIIPGAMGCLITGIWLAVRTHWGFANYYWVMMKSIGNIFLILFGGIVIRNWIHDQLDKVFSSSLHPLQSALYLEHRTILLSCLAISLAVILFLVLISYVKPWGKVKKA